MSKLLTVFKSTSERAKNARRDIYALLILLLISGIALIYIEPLNKTIFHFLESTFSNVDIEKILLFFVIFCVTVCIYLVRRWKEIYTEATQGKELEKQLLHVQSDLESQVREKTEDFRMANLELDRKNNALEVLNTITRAIHNSLDIEKVCEMAIEMSTTLDYVDTTSLYIVNETGTSAELKYHSSNLPNSYIKKASVINYPDGITWKVINSGEIEIIEGTEENTEIGPAGYELNFGAILGVPIKIEDKNAGVVWFAGKEKRKFSESELDLLTSLSSHLSIALNRAKVYKELYKKNRYETLVNSVSKVVHESINLSEVLENAVEALSVNIIKAHNVSIYLIEGENAVLKSYRGYKEDFIKKVAIIPYKKGFTWKAILDRKPIYCSDSEDDIVIGEAGKELGTKSYLSMPIKSGNHVVGVININSLSKDAFDSEELKLLEIVSAQIENAINNANYAEALRKSEELLWEKISQLSTKSKYESIIRSITDSVHESLDLGEILKNAAESIREKINPVEHVAIHIVSENIAELKASSSIEGAYLDKLSSIPSPQGLIWKSMKDAKTTYDPNLNNSEDKLSLLELGIKSFVSVPLFQKGKPVGAVSVSSYKDKAFSTEDLDAFEMVSKQIQAAISNANQAEVLSISENRYRTLFEQSPLGVYLFNNDFVITNCNDRMCQIIKSPRDEIIGLDMNTLKDLKFLEVMKRGLSGEIIQHEGYYEATTSNNNLWLSLSVAPLRDKDQKVTGAIALVEDRTDVRKANEQITTAQRLESLGILAGGIAHDFNNILTAILGNLSLAKYYETDNKELLGILTDAEAASNRAKELTHQLLTFAKGGEPVTKLVDITKVVNESSSFALAGSNIGLDFDIPDGIWYLEADEGQLNQVFNNLVINAQQSMPDGGHINVSIKNIVEKNDSLMKGNFVKISIIDHGVGIPKEYIPKIFDPYFTTKNKGTGLGLSTSHSIVEKHGGFITMDSNPGGGSTFNVFLPASQDQIEDLKIYDNNLIEGSGNVLIMDDEKDVRDTVGSMLERLGYDVSYSTDGEEAIDFYATALNTESKYDAVILDLTIPGGMGGKQTILKLRELDPDIKAIVSSGYSNNPVMSDYKNYGFSGILAKPYTLTQLSKVLDDLVGV